MLRDEVEKKLKHLLSETDDDYTVNDLWLLFARDIDVTTFMAIIKDWEDHQQIYIEKKDPMYVSWIPDIGEVDFVLLNDN
jgi:hypothetical protein